MDAKLAKLARFAGPVARDLVGITGAAMIAGGCWMIWAPLGLIVGGVLLLAAAILSAVRKQA